MKTKEELKLQMGEVLPNAIPLMAKAAQDAGLTMDGTVKSMMALQQSGGLISSKVLPFFAKRMSEAARANGGLENAMNSNRVAMNRLATSAQVAADTIFKSGWGEGLTEIFNVTAAMIKENEVLWISLGKIMGKVFKAIAWVIDKVLAPALSGVGSILNWLISIFSTTEGKIAGVGLVIWKLVKYVRLATTAFGLMGIAVSASMWPVTALIAGLTTAFMLLEEIAEVFQPTGKKTVLGWNVDDMPKDLKETMGFGKSDKATETTGGGSRQLGFVDSWIEVFRRIGDFRLKTGTNFPSSMSELGDRLNPLKSNTPINVTVQSYINMDKELVATALGNTEGIRSSIDSRISENSSNV